ncbi:glycosyltransferase family 4 protein [Notoacmeibacter ruber]|uniref:Glycosyltransferase family 1 protein n=1 Tax=Notoacmeibacter ruber TaxID=2670375 RepID=A0A3L7JA78_9HYPH|nr:glycosyltransferase family 4 protein [Notoacmeibacter ruber]RLQ87324.1 glycosyltransferase family 1 protein [Notoacmeibacter ruber]
MRIVHCFRSPVGGIFRHVRDLAHQQELMGHQVGIICDSNTGTAFENQALDDLASQISLGVHRFHMQRNISPRDLISFLDTHRHLGKLKPDLIHGHGAKGGAYSRILGTLPRLGGRPLRFYSPHGGSLHYDEATREGKFFARAERQLSRICDGICFVSEYERQAFLRKVGRPRCASRLVYNGVSRAEFEPVPLNGDAADFLFIGMMRDLKGPDLFVNAFSRLVENDTARQPRAVMVGDGPDRQALEQAVAERGLSHLIRFRDPMPIREAMRLARHVVQPSRAEALPYTVLEVLAAGRTMIATLVGGIPEILGPDSIALMAPNEASIADRMAALLAAPERFAAAMPDREIMQDRFSLEAMATAIMAFYREQQETKRS